MADEVQFTDEQWEAVAKAAEVFAEALDAERSKLVRVVVSNWAGACAEGEATTANLQLLLRGEAGSFSEAIASESTYLKSIASQCRSSKSILNLADETADQRFRQ